MFDLLLNSLGRRFSSFNTLAELYNIYNVFNIDCILNIAVFIYQEVLGIWVSIEYD